MSLFALDANDAYMKVRGVSARERAINNARYDFETQVVRNPGYEGTALRNGQPQQFLVTRSDVTYKCTVVAYPGEPLAPGDIIEIDGEHWIMHQTRVTNAVQISGTAWLCNHKFRFQTFSSEIHERWGVLDSGVYSTTRTSDSTIMSLDSQFKIYLPDDEVTSLIHEDQRLAADQWVDKEGNPIMLCYSVTGRDRVSRSYGDGGHLLMLYVRSSTYNHETDNFEEMICDYISPETEPVSEQEPEKYYHIEGRNFVRIGSNRTYHATLRIRDMDDDQEPDRIVWSYLAPDGVSVVANGSKVTLAIPENKKLVGEMVTLFAIDPEERYGRCGYEIEVTL